LVKLFGDPELSSEARKEAERKLDPRMKAARAKFFSGLGEQPERAAVESFLGQFARRAWRRPVAAAETARLVKIFDAALAAGAEPREALRKALKPVLVAPDFLFRIEEDRTPATVPAAAKAAVRI